MKNDCISFSLCQNKHCHNNKMAVTILKLVVLLRFLEGAVPLDKHGN